MALQLRGVEQELHLAWPLKLPTVIWSARRLGLDRTRQAVAAIEQPDTLLPSSQASNHQVMAKAPGPSYSTISPVIDTPGAQLGE
jgi:hypothetical protein